MAIVRSTVVYEDGTIKEYTSSGKRAFSSFSLVKKQVRRGGLRCACAQSAARKDLGGRRARCASAALAQNSRSFWRC